MTNLRQGCNSVGHELIARFLVSVTQLSLNILFGKDVRGVCEWEKKTDSVSKWNRMHLAVSHHDDNAYCATAGVVAPVGGLQKHYVRSR